MKRHAEIGTQLDAPIGMSEEPVRGAPTRAQSAGRGRGQAAAQIKPVKKMTEAEYDAWYVGRILA